MPMRDEINTEMQREDFGRHFRARLDIAMMQGDKLVKQYRENVATALINAGITLIPSDHLRDHEYVVSRGVYEAAKKICGTG